MWMICQNGKMILSSFYCFDTDLLKGEKDFPSNATLQRRALQGCNGDVRERSYRLSPVKQICVFEHSVMTNFNRACPAIQRG